LWDALMSLPQGHQALGPSPAITSEADIEAAMAMGFDGGPMTLYGTCLSPYKDHAVVMNDAGELHHGDEIVAIDGKRGADLQAYVMRQPDGADLIPPTVTGRFAFAIRAFLGRDRNGMKLTIVRPGTSGERDVTLPAAAPTKSALSCSDPFDRDDAPKGTLLSDGTGLLYVPGFPQPAVSDFESEVGPEFDKVKKAPRLIIDLRSNYGGNLLSALDLVGQLPGAKAVDYSQFYNRIPNTEPPQYTLPVIHSVTPPDAATARFAYGGRVALLVDGATFSSGEHFILAARAAKANVVVIGTKTAGAYGNTSRDVPKPLYGKLQVTVNRSQVRTMDDKVLDGVSQEPDIVVEYEPAAIAAGHDPMVERAVAELSK
jgi:C-terminal processing protease CtpA/Prc